MSNNHKKLKYLTNKSSATKRIQRKNNNSLGIGKNIQDILGRYTILNRKVIKKQLSKVE